MFFCKAVFKWIVLGWYLIHGFLQSFWFSKVQLVAALLDSSLPPRNLDVFLMLFLLSGINISWHDSSSLEADSSWGYGLLEQGTSISCGCFFKGWLRAMGLAASFYPTEVFMSFVFSFPWVPARVSLVVKDEMRLSSSSFSSWLCFVLSPFLSTQFIPPRNTLCLPTPGGGVQLLGAETLISEFTGFSVI